MACRRVTQIMWAVAVVFAVIVVAQNGRMCWAAENEMGMAENTVINRARETAHSWTDDLSGRWAHKQEGVEDLMEKAKDVVASDRNEYASEKVNTCTASVKDNGEELYDEANHKVEEAYNMVRKSGLSEEAKVMYEAAKERASDVAGEVGAKIGHQ